MHLLEHLAGIAKKTMTMRYQRMLEELEALDDWAHILCVASITFDRERGTMPFEFEVACELAARATDKVDGLPITSVSVTGIPPGDYVQIIALNSQWSGVYRMPAEELMQRWDEAAIAVASRFARDEMCRGRGAALKEGDRHAE